VPTPYVRLPPPLPAPATGDAALDALLAEAYATTAEGRGVDEEPFAGHGAALASCVTKELFDPGETVWDDVAVNALPVAERTALKQAADLAYRQRMGRRHLRGVLVRAIAAAPEGRAVLRDALARSEGWPERLELAAALVVDGSREDLEAVANAVPENTPHPTGVLAAQARLDLDPAWGSHLADARDVSWLACVLIAVNRRLAPGALPDRRWRGLALRVLESGGPFAQFGYTLLARFPADEELLADLLREAPRTREHTMLLARHDTPEVFPRFVTFAAESSFADTPILEALEKSAHVEAAHTVFAIVATLEALPNQGSRVKRYAKLAKVLGPRFGVKPPKKAKAAPAPAVEVPPPPPAPPVVRPNLPPYAALEATLTKALADAGLASHQAELVSPAVALLLERADLATFAVGASRFGGPPDLPESTPWPAVKKAPMTFVGQLDLAEIAKLAGTGGSKLAPASGLLSFFVHDSDPENYGQKGAVLLTEAGSPLVRRGVPKAMVDQGRALAPACRVELVPTLRLVHPTNRAVTHGLSALLAEAYGALHASLGLPRVSHFLGHRDRYDAAVKRGQRLLLLVTSDPQANFQWGDLDELAFFIGDKALAASEFSKVDVRVGD